MAHDICVHNGEASMMYAGETPWHKLGTKLDGPVTSAEAIKAAKLGWEVVKRPIYAVGDGCMFPIPDKEAVLRKGEPGKPDGPVFGVVSKHYTPFQNTEAFEFFDSIVEGKQAIYHTAGALGKGERVWILAKLPGSIRVVGDDITDKYLLLSNSHDASSAIQVKFTPIRVVCQNTLTMALTGGSIRIAHTRAIEEQLEQAKELLGLVQDRYADIEESFKAMARVQMDSRRLDNYLNSVFPIPVQPDVTSLFGGPRHHCSVGQPTQSRQGPSILLDTTGRCPWCRCGLEQRDDYPGVVHHGQPGKES